MSRLHTDKICVKSPAKINLHLEIIGKRFDEFHELAMIMQNIALFDFLEFESNDTGKIKLNSDCNDLSLKDDNLIIKAANYIKGISDNRKLGANIFLKKNIPIGAGLAGGSSNAAATLIGLDKLWNLNLDYETIISLCAKLGSDVPFFVDGGCQLCFGRGEILEKCNYNFDYGVILLKNPKNSISTSDAYKKYSKKFGSKLHTEFEKINLIRNDLRINGFNELNSPKKIIKLKNDLQLIAQEENDSVNQALNLLSNLQNCFSVSMSGSGPTCFALFKDINNANDVFAQNQKLFYKNGFDSWVCKFINNGITFL